MRDVRVTFDRDETSRLMAPLTFPHNNVLYLALWNEQWGCGLSKSTNGFVSILKTFLLNIMDGASIGEPVWPDGGTTGKAILLDVLDDVTVTIRTHDPR